MSQRNEWRVFCAVELPDVVRARLDQHILHLRRDVADAAASWSRVENIHLTLKFFGNVEVERIQKIAEAAERAVNEFHAFQIGIGATGVFPRPSRPQVLWIGVSDLSGQLSSLQERFEKECGAEGFAKEDRPFRPHLTIARLRKPEGSRRLAETHLGMRFEAVDVVVNEIVVFRSELSPKGAKYTTISRHQLNTNRGFRG